MAEENPFAQFITPPQTGENPFAQFVNNAPPLRDESVADQVPVLNEANRFYEQARAKALEYAPQVASKILNFATGTQGQGTEAPIRTAMEFSTPSTIPEAGVQALIGWGAGKLAAPALEKLTTAFRSTRPLQQEIAQKALGNLLPEEAKAAEAWFQKAGKAGEEARTVMGRVGSHEFPVQLTEKGTAKAVQEGSKVPFEDMQAALKQMKDEKLPYADIQNYKRTIEDAYPGFLKHEQGYAKLMDMARTQKMTVGSDPLKAFENDVATGRVIGGSGEVVKQGGKATHFMSEKELADVRDIMDKLGPAPGEHFWHKMLAGHAVGGLAGAAVGYNEGGLSGAKIGGAVGIAVPTVINKIIVGMLKHPSSRAFLKRAMTQETALASPEFWQTAGAMLTRLGQD